MLTDKQQNAHTSVNEPILSQEESGQRNSGSDSQPNLLQKVVRSRVVARFHVRRVLAREAALDHPRPREALVVLALETLASNNNVKIIIKPDAMGNTEITTDSQRVLTARCSMSSSTFGKRSIAQLIHLWPMHSTSPMLQTKLPASSTYVPAAGTGRKSIVFRNLSFAFRVMDRQINFR